MFKISKFTKIKSLILGSLLSSTSFAEEIKIGVLLPLTGSQAFYGKEAKNGIDLAFKNYSNPNLKIKLVVEDTQSTPLEAAKGINKLITTDKVSVVIAEVISSNAIAAASIAEKAKIPIISPAATNDSVTLGKKYVFRTCFVDSFQGVVMANFAAKNLKAKNAMILEDSDSDYSKGLSDSFNTTFTKLGGNVIKVLKYSQKDTNFTAQLGDVRKRKPDIVFIPGFHQQVGVILKEAKELNISAKMLGGDGWFTPELRLIAKGAEIGGFTSTHYSTDSTKPNVTSFIEEYSKKYAAKPSAHAALGYDTFNLITHALKNLQSIDSAKITEALSKVKDFHGITGDITMDQNHNPIKPAVILEYIPDGYKYVTSIAPDKP